MHLYIGICKKSVSENLHCKYAVLLGLRLTRIMLKCIMSTEEEKFMKKFLCFIVLLTVIVSVFAFSGCTKPANRAEVDLTFDGLGTKPSDEVAATVQGIDKSKITLSSETTTDKAVLESIRYLLKLSNQNNIDIDFYAAAAYGTGDAYIPSVKIVGSMDTREWRLYDNGEYFFDSYGLIVDGYKKNDDGSKGSVPSGILSALSMVLNFTERVYSPDSQTFYKAKDGKSSVDTFSKYPSLDAITYKKPEIQKSSLEQYIKENYYRNSFKDYITDDLDYEEAITEGSLTYDAEKGLYTIKCEINCTNEIALDLSIKSMKESAGTDIFKYARKSLTIEIWDCGLIRKYINENKWEATLLPTSFKLKGSSENYYEQIFAYNKDAIEKMVIPEDVKTTWTK